DRIADDARHRGADEGEAEVEVGVEDDLVERVYHRAVLRLAVAQRRQHLLALDGDAGEVDEAVDEAELVGVGGEGARVADGEGAEQTPRRADDRRRGGGDDAVTAQRVARARLEAGVAGDVRDEEALPAVGGVAAGAAVGPDLDAVDERFGEARSHAARCRPIEAPAALEEDRAHPAGRTLERDAEEGPRLGD